MRTMTGWESLSRTERIVARLVGHGLRYRQIAEQLGISRRTVESHVAHIFSKLDISSRRDLAEIAERQIRRCDG